MAERRVLVTGGTGLAGKSIQAYVEENDIKGTWIYANSKDADLLDRQAVEEMFKKHQPTHVLHLAARVGGLFANMKAKLDFFRENVTMNDNVMECCRIYKVEKLLSCLSTCIFPADPPEYPITEKMLHIGEPHKSNYGYAMAKRMVDSATYCYRDQYNCNFITVAPANLYGPNDNFSIEDGHVIPGLIHKCHIANRDSTDFTLWGTGKPRRQFLYVKDFARLLVWALFNYNDGETLLLTPPAEDETAIYDIATMIKDSMKFEGKMVQDLSKSDGQFSRTMSNKKLQSLLPEFKFTPLSEGIKETTEWFNANFDNARLGH